MSVIDPLCMKIVLNSHITDLSGFYRVVQHVPECQDKDPWINRDHLQRCRVQEHSHQTSRGCTSPTGKQVELSYNWLFIILNTSLTSQCETVLKQLFLCVSVGTESATQTEQSQVQRSPREDKPVAASPPLQDAAERWAAVRHRGDPEQGTELVIHGDFSTEWTVKFLKWIPVCIFNPCALSVGGSSDPGLRWCAVQ